MSYMKDQVDKETIDQKERSDVHMSYMKDQVDKETIVDIWWTHVIHEEPGRDQETIVRKEESDVHMSYMKNQVETKKP